MNNNKAIGVAISALMIETTTGNNVAYSNGMDREAYADLEDKDTNEKLSLYADALTYYAKAQLCAQMVMTQINQMKP